MVPIARGRSVARMDYIDRELKENAVKLNPDIFERTGILKHVKEHTFLTSDIVLEVNGIDEKYFTDISYEEWKLYINEKITIVGSASNEEKTAIHVCSICFHLAEEIKDYIIHEFPDIAESMSGRDFFESHEFRLAAKARNDFEKYADMKDCTLVNSSLMQIDDLVVAYAVNRDTFSPRTREIVESIFRKYRNALDYERKTYLKCLRFYLNHHETLPLAIKEKDLEKAKDHVMRNYPGQKAAISKIFNLLVNVFKGYCKLSEIPLICVDDGQNGFVKLIQIICDSIGFTMKIMDLCGMSNKSNITGSSSIYDNCTIGMLADYLQDNTVAMFTHADLYSEDEVFRSLATLVRGEYFNELIGITDTSSNWCILQVSSLDNISKDVRDYANIITLEPFSDEEKAEHCRLLIKKTAKGTGYECDVDDDVISDFIVKNSAGIDGLYMTTANILQNAAAAGIHRVTRDNISLCFELIKRTEYLIKNDANNIIDVKEKSLVCGSDFPYRHDVQKKLIEYENTFDVYGKKAIIEKASELINIRRRRPKIDAALLRKHMDRRLYGQKQAKDTAQDIFSMLSRTNCNKCTAILCYGGSGLGKTVLAYTLSKACELPLFVYHLNQMISEEELTGSRLSKGILGQFADCRSDSAIVLMDEVDKARPNVISSLYNMLDGQKIHDYYYDVDVDLSGTIFIFTANNLSNIPESLLSRMELINFEPYARSEERKILTEYVFPTILSNMEIDSCESFNDSLVEYILDTAFNAGPGVRALETCAEKIMRRACRCKVRLADVDAAFAEQVLGFNRPARHSASVGQATALAVVTAGIGTCFDVQTEECEQETDIHITGNAEGSFLESIYLASYVTGKMLGRTLTNMRIHMTSAGIKKDGPSAGLCIAAAIMSSVLNRPLGNCAFTGEITLSMDVRPVGGITEKLAAARRAGINRVFIPKENYDALRKSGRLELFELELIPVSTLEELWNYVNSIESI